MVTLYTKVNTIHLPSHGISIPSISMTRKAQRSIKKTGKVFISVKSKMLFFDEFIQFPFIKALV